MKLTRLLVPATFVLLLSCQSSPEGDSAKITDTVISVSDHSRSDTIKLTPPMVTYAAEISDPATVEFVRTALRAKFKDDLAKNLIDSFSRKFSFFSYDLNDDGKKEILVALTGPYFCGSGGCSPLILNEPGKIITQFSVSEYPIIADNVKSKGWKDLFIFSAGKYHVVKFDGKKYPSNPSVQPVLKLIPGDGLPRLLDTEHEPYPWFTF